MEEEGGIAASHPLLWLASGGSGFPEGKEVFVGSQQRSIRIPKLPFRYRWTVGCQLNLVAIAPFVPLLLSSAQHIRAPVVEENLRNSPAATGSSY